MRKPRIVALAVLAAGATVLLLTSPAGAGDNGSGFNTSQAVDDHAARAGLDRAADHLGRRDDRELPLRVDPGRDLRAGGGPHRRGLRQPRDLARAVPVRRDGPTSNSQNDFDNAQVSSCSWSKSSAGILSGSYAIPSSANFQRFCSNFLAGPAERVRAQPLLFTNEEATDFVNRTGTAPGRRGRTPSRRASSSRTTRANEYRPIYGIGRMNHENSVAIPGYGLPVLLSGDDTFTAPCPSSTCTRRERGRRLERQRRALRLQVGQPVVNDYGDLDPDQHERPVHPGSAAIARGDQTGARELVEREQRLPVHPDRGPRVRQEPAERRLLRRHGRAAGDPRPGPARLTRGPAGTNGPFPNGRIFRLQLDPSDDRTSSACRS